MAEGIVDKVVNVLREEVARGVRQALVPNIERMTGQVKKRVLSFVLKTIFLILAVVSIVLGLILLGAKYIGAEFTLLGVGILMLFGFLLF